MRGIKTVTINFLIFVLLYAIVEGGAWAITHAYRSYRESVAGERNETVSTDSLKNTGEKNADAIYSSAAVAEDHIRRTAARGSSHAYENYLVYRPRPFASRYVNVSENGRRSNGSATSSPESPRVWMFGPSALFGTPNADNETIPASLELRLREKRADHAANVHNYGVVAYSSWQELLNFQIRLFKEPKPDLVIFFNGINDHYLAWLNDKSDCGDLLNTGLGSREILTQAWDARANNEIVNWPVVRDKLSSLFSNTIELSRLADKYFIIRSAQKDIATWRKQYRSARDAHAAIVARCLPVEEKNYLQNMRMAADLAKANNIKVAFVQQPFLFETTKPLTESERTALAGPDDNFFTLNDTELEVLQKVPTYRVFQPHYWSKAQFIATYSRQEKALKQLAEETGARFIDVKAPVNDAGPVAIFSDQTHFTFRGTKIIGEHIADAIEDLISK